MLQNRGGLDRAQFLAARNQLLGAAAQDQRLAGVRPNGVEDAPQFKLDIDREKASALGISIADINSDAADRLGIHLRQRLHRSRSRQARVRAGRSRLAHAARGPQSLVRAQQARAAWCRSRRSAAANGPTDRRSSCASMAFRPTRSRAGPRRAGARARRCRPWKNSSPNYPPASVSNGPACPTKKRRPARRRRMLYALSLADRVPVPRGAVRELVDPGDRVAGRAAGRARRGHRDAGARTHQ